MIYKKSFLQLLQCSILSLLFCIVLIPRVNAANVLGTIEISSYNCLWTGSCFDCNSDKIFSSVDAACKFVYGPLAKTGAMLFWSLDPSLPKKCDPYVRAACPYGDTCDWYRYECVEITPPSCSISASPDSIMSGTSENITVSWTTADAVTATLNGVSVTPNVSGSQIFTGVSIATTYTLAVTGDTVVPPCTVTVGIFVPPTGGLIPCGRMVNNPDTDDIDESQPCSICTLFYMLKNIINFIITLSVGVAVFILIMSGFFYALSAGNSRTVDLAKSAATSAIIGIAIITVVWLVIAVILQGLGYASFTTWNQISCILPT